MPDVCPPQRAGLFPQRHHDRRQQAERHNAPAKKGDRERRNAAGNAARQNHVRDLRGRDQQKPD
jgi:hypothetical protein